jgi:hypothetical protein
VNHRHCFEALDRTLRDIMSSTDHASANKQFGGITVVLGGDFRQTLPVIPNGKKTSHSKCVDYSVLFVAPLHCHSVNRKHEAPKFVAFA